MSKRLVVISVDALSVDNWEQVNSLPTFRALLEQGAFSRELRSVFPTLTYAVHTTMVTGVHPATHGILHNNPLQPLVPEKEKAWYWYSRVIRAQTIYEVASAHGLRTAALLWPVTGGANINYNLPEIAALPGENQALKVRRHGSPLFCLELELRFGRLRSGASQPALDNFVTASAVHTLRTKRPDLMLIHLIDLDDKKHYFGTDSLEARQALERMDSRLAAIIGATKAAGTFAETAFLVIGDHGQLNVDYRVRPNNLLREQGLINLDGGKSEWRAYVQCSGGSAYLYVREGDLAAHEKAMAILLEAAGEDKYGIEAVHGPAAFPDLCGAHGIAAVIEARQGYYFDEAIAEPTVHYITAPGKQYATHGYSPHKPDYTCLFIAAGNGVLRRGDLGALEMVDIAPTMANLLGLPFSRRDGRPIAGLG